MEGIIIYFEQVYEIAYLTMIPELGDCFTKTNFYNIHLYLDFTMSMLESYIKICIILNMQSRHVCMSHDTVQQCCREMFC